MNSQKIEYTVGLFVMAGLVCIAYLAIHLGGLPFLNDESYVLRARFNTVGSLNKGASVRIAGVTVGSVESMELDKTDFVAIVNLRLAADIELEDDTIASIKSNGLIGDKYIDLTPGASGIVMEAGDTIIDTESAVDIEGLISRFAFGGVEE